MGNIIPFVFCDHSSSNCDESILSYDTNNSVRRSKRSNLGVRPARYKPIKEPINPLRTIRKKPLKRKERKSKDALANRRRKGKRIIKTKVQ